MLCYTAPERGILVTIYLTNNRSMTLAQREFRRRYPSRPTPTGETLRRLAARLEETGTTQDAARRCRPRSSRSAENIAAVAEDVMETPSTSTRRRATQMGSDEKLDYDEERRSVGRPASGGETLNIVRTGRGQGRPKKDVAAKRAGDSENGNDSPKKRGRPSSSGKGAYQPTGKPRGRPKTTADKESLDEEDDKDDEDDEPSKDAAENSADDDEGNDKIHSGSEDAI